MISSLIKSVSLVHSSTGNEGIGYNGISIITDRRRLDLLNLNDISLYPEASLSPSYPLNSMEGRYITRVVFVKSDMSYTSLPETIRYSKVYDDLSYIIIETNTNIYLLSNVNQFGHCSSKVLIHSCELLS